MNNWINGIATNEEIKEIKKIIPHNQKGVVIIIYITNTIKTIRNHETLKNIK
jgi:hypothetical protein